jgi:hypothetical protein
MDEATYGEGGGSLCVLFKLFIASEIIEKKFTFEFVECAIKYQY